MSIINEALKKASGGKEKLYGAKELGVESQPKKKAQAKKRINKRLIILAIFSLSVPALLLSFILLQNSSVRKKIEEVKYQPGTSTEELVSSTQIVEESDAQEAVILAGKPPSLSLTGIIWGYGRPAALINNRIVKEGDLIEGAEVLEIRQNEVKLNFGGQELSLSLE